MKKIIAMTAFMFCTSAIGAAENNMPILGKETVSNIVKALTLEEKVRLLVGTCQMQPQPPYPAPGTFVRQSKSGANTATIKGRVAGSAGESYAVERLGIPSLVYADGPAGVRISPTREGTTQRFNATAFPSGSMLASTWDYATIEHVGQCIGNEAREYGVDIMLTPGMNIQRNPLCGRNFEYYSEDPLLAGKTAAAMVRGIQSEGVGASVKHFAVNNQETFRNGINVIVSNRALREIYLKAFEIAVKEAQPLTIMSSYNKVNGSYVSESYLLLTDILRNEWGFKGFVLTDWWAEHNPVAQMAAGNDQLMPGTEDQIQEIISAVSSGKLSETVIDQNVARILEVTTQLPAFRHYAYSNKPDMEAHSLAAREAAAEGMVLLKNDSQTLPLKRRCRPALFGVSNYDLIAGGSGSGYVHKRYKVSPMEGLTAAGMKPYGKLADIYSAYIADTKSRLPEETFWTVPIVPECAIEPNDIQQAAHDADVAIVAIGRSSGEGTDRQVSEGDYLLNATERALLTEVSSCFHSQGKRVVVLLNISSIIEMTSWQHLADAILLCWMPGQEGGHAIADLLAGKKSPSGRLPMTIPARYEDTPSAENFPLTNMGTNAKAPACVVYGEDIFVGYRYFDTFGVAPAYPFGYGLSYTQFNYAVGDSHASGTDSAENLEITIPVTITNSGKHAGREVVQLYVSAPKGRLSKPATELKAFAKTGTLKPGEKQTVTFTLKARDLASWDGDEDRWLCEAGEYTFHIGASSRDFRGTTSVTLQEMTIEKTNKQK
jgi:beta-glucosidase